MTFKELRINAGYKTQDALAQDVKVKQGTVAMWETNRRIPKGKMLIVLSKKLDCTIDDIFDCFQKAN